MVADSKIEWTRHTFNPWIGCTKASRGCEHCYAERFGARMGVKWGAGAARRMTSESTWKDPLKWNRQALLEQKPALVFCASLTDVFEEFEGPIETHRGRVMYNSRTGEFSTDVPRLNDPDDRPACQDDLHTKLFRIIENTPNLRWLLLTKRPENVLSTIEWCLDTNAESWLKGNDHVAIGASIEDQPSADKRIPELLKIPASMLFVSVEPLLGPITLNYIQFNREVEIDALNGTHGFIRPHREINPKLDWVIAGGESGPQARPAHPDWFRSLYYQCQASNVPFFFKSWGEWAPVKKEGDTLTLTGTCNFTDKPKWHEFQDGQVMAKIGKRASGASIDGKEYMQRPETWIKESL
jgi:protein gp37